MRPTSGTTVRLGTVGQRQVVPYAVLVDPQLDRSGAVVPVVARDGEGHAVEVEEAGELVGRDLPAPESGREVPERPLPLSGLKTPSSS